jgi:hypothetical protein
VGATVLEIGSRIPGEYATYPEITVSVDAGQGVLDH